MPVQSSWLFFLFLAVTQLIQSYYTFYLFCHILDWLLASALLQCIIWTIWRICFWSVSHLRRVGPLLHFCAVGFKRCTHSNDAATRWTKTERSQVEHIAQTALCPNKPSQCESRAAGIRLSSPSNTRIHPWGIRSNRFKFRLHNICLSWLIPFLKAACGSFQGKSSANCRSAFSL